MVTGTDEFGSIICEGYDIERGSMLFFMEPLGIQISFTRFSYVKFGV